MFFKKNKHIKTKDFYRITSEVKNLDLFVIFTRIDWIDEETERTLNNISIDEQFNRFIRCGTTYIASKDLFEFYSFLEKEFLFEGYEVDRVSLSETRWEPADKFPLAGSKYNRLRFGIDIKDNIYIT